MVHALPCKAAATAPSATFKTDRYHEGSSSMKKLLIAGISLVALGCTDTNVASLMAYGSSGEIVCYSGGQVIYKGRSTGKIQTVTQSDGWEFKDASTGKFVRVSGACVIQN